MNATARVNKYRPTLLAVAVMAMLASGVAVVRYLPSADAGQQPAGEHAAPQLPKVDVVTLASRPLRLWSEYSGRLSAVSQVAVRPQVSGTVQQVLFEEGQRVAAGDPLYVIDPRPYEAAVASAEAALASARHRSRLAGLELKRAKDLINKRVISQRAYDTIVNDYRVAAASIDAAEAALQQARLNLEYAHIKAPVSGRISRAELTVGNLVQAGANAPVLTTIVSDDRFYAEFEVDEQTYVRAVRQGGLSSAMPVELVLSGDDSVVYQGRVHAFDNRLDTRSGTIRARAIFDNSDGALVAGMYARVRLGSADRPDTLLVSERAIGTDQDRKFVYVVDGEGKVAYREVSLGRSVDGQRVVESGLNAGDQVIVNGLHRIRPNMQVAPVELAAKSAGAGKPEQLASR
ncbi:efflux RND transporter periplasmic adaptor subunit [Marinobacterium arenosum]|uniref:efflux RND transporter periplasmic adaptor subunit n=1 Tax=Marinobacterium arenosum TaxID=2862496 RepID=UPI001C9411B5|nr:efflux RND transporter periplasmic adaptor subunit [Marinobacterium arenosum]MBY4675041.1 efflux RND transporter periplasmic adaptor subunit [Marinobacterium arenosum]